LWLGASFERTTPGEPDDKIGSFFWSNSDKYGICLAESAQPSLFGARNRLPLQPDMTEDSDEGSKKGDQESVSHGGQFRRLFGVHVQSPVKGDVSKFGPSDDSRGHVANDTFTDDSAGPRTSTDSNLRSWTPRTFPSSSMSLDESYKGFGLGRDQRKDMVGAINAFSGLVTDDHKPRSHSDSALTEKPAHLFSRRNKFDKFGKIQQNDSKKNYTVKRDFLPSSAFIDAQNGASKFSSPPQDGASNFDNLSPGGATDFDNSDSFSIVKADDFENVNNSPLAKFKPVASRREYDHSLRDSHQVVLGVKSVESLECAGIPNVKFTFDSIRHENPRHRLFPPVVHVTSQPDSDDSEIPSSFDLNDSIHVRFKNPQAGNKTANSGPKHVPVSQHTPNSSFDLSEQVHVRFGDSQEPTRHKAESESARRSDRGFDTPHRGFGRHLYPTRSRVHSAASTTSISSIGVPSHIRHRRGTYDDSFSSFDEFLNGYLGFIDDYSGAHAWDTSGERMRGIQAEIQLKTAALINRFQIIAQGGAQVT
jgi:hypothetical protein